MLYRKVRTPPSAGERRRAASLAASAELARRQLTHPDEGR